MLATRSASPIVSAMNSNQQPPYHIGKIAGKLTGVYGATGEQIADCSSVSFTDKESTANAAFIVTACNAYEANQATIAKQQATIKALTEVLSELVCRFDFLSDKETSGVPVHWREIAANGSIAKARAVLAQAKEGQQ